MPDVKAAGVRFNLERDGNGGSVVFVHGLEGDLHSWDRLFADLGSGFDRLRYDLRGCGASSHPPGQIFDHAEDLTALLDAMDIRSCSLIGMSKGGGIALNFALDHPDRVEKLVLISPAIIAWDWSPQWRELWRPMVEEARAGRLDAARRRWWLHPLFDSVRNGPDGPALRQAALASSGAEWLDDRQRHRLPDVDRLPMLAVRTLLLTGERDMPDFRVIADLIAGSSDLVTRKDVPGAGHMLTLERPEFCAREIRAFLEAGK